MLYALFLDVYKHRFSIFRLLQTNPARLFKRDSRMIPQTKGRGQGCEYRLLPPGRYSAETKKRRSIRPIKTLFRTPRASGGNKKKQKYPRAFPTENPQIGKRGQGNLSVGKIEKPQRKKPERLQNKIRAEKTSRPPPAAAAATLPKPINCTLSAKRSLSGSSILPSVFPCDSSLFVTRISIITNLSPLGKRFSTFFFLPRGNSARTAQTRTAQNVRAYFPYTDICA